MTFEITLLLFLLAVSAFFSGSETALFSLGPIKTRRYRADRPKRNRLTAHILANPRRLLITLLIGNMLVNTLASSVSASLFRQMRLPAAAVISALSITILILIFGEIIPKTYAIENAEKVSLRTAYLIYGFSVITYPLRRVIRVLSDLIIAPITRLLPKEKTLTHGELETAVKMGLDSGAVDAQEQKLIEGVLDFETKKVREIMRPRPDIFALDLSMHLDEIGRAISEHQYSRVPIYDGELSNIVGILYAKDVIEIDRSNLEDFDLKTILRPPY
ncbi:MAG: HlyC/CorC family transporter, partial [Thermoplasmata archaeon]|nr:HlyC/CorC family transporter [Thermoplasmata archaeon]